MSKLSGKVTGCEPKKAVTKKEILKDAKRKAINYRLEVLCIQEIQCRIDMKKIEIEELRCRIKKMEIELEGEDNE